MNSNKILTNPQKMRSVLQGFSIKNTFGISFAKLASINKNENDNDDFFSN